MNKYLVLSLFAVTACHSNGNLYVRQDRNDPVLLVANVNSLCFEEISDMLDWHAGSPVVVISPNNSTGHEPYTFSLGKETVVTFNDTPYGTTCDFVLTTCDYLKVREALYACTGG